jgi:simple sugar transport system ATP-binding protein
LELRQISRRFGETIALVDASLNVTAGTIHALLGENGAGKTTLMRIAYGMLAPDRGEIRIDDSRRRFFSPADAIAAGVGMVQQHPSNVGGMTVWENVVLGGKGTLDPAHARRNVEALITDLGFSLDANALVNQLTVVAQQRVEILKAIYREARLLILDEPTAILAPEEAKELYAWLRGFAGRGGTAVVVTHKLDEARRYTDDLTVLRAGRTVLTSTSAGVSSDELTLAMIGDALAASPPVVPRHPGEPVLRAAHLSLRDERRVTVLRDATLEVRAGEILGVAGVEGSGHHHLLLAMAGRHPPSAGHIDLAARTTIIPEDRHRNGVVLSFSLIENAAIRNAGARRGVLGWPRLTARVRAFMDRFDVRAPGPSAPMSTLSGGNQQKFVLARELDDAPRLVVAENPTRGLDIRAAAFVRDQLRAARDDGVAVVFYSSDLDEIMDIADRVLVVQGGRVTEVPKDRTRIGAAMLGAA